MRVTSYDVELDEKIPILVKDRSVNYTDVGAGKLEQPELIVSVLNSVFRLDKKAEEYMYLICLDTKGHPIGFFAISKGTVKSSFCNPREVLIRALLSGATGIVLAHNHPSGDSTPSIDDMHVTKRLKEACQIIGIEFWDHIIVCEENFTSFAREGLLN